MTLKEGQVLLPFLPNTQNAHPGLLLRMDHASQYLSDHFVNQVRFWGIKPSFAYVEQL